jgi:hypothetical protein
MFVGYVTIPYQLKSFIAKNEVFSSLLKGIQWHLVQDQFHFQIISCSSFMNVFPYHSILCSMSSWNSIVNSIRINSGDWGNTEWVWFLQTDSLNGAYLFNYLCDSNSWRKIYDDKHSVWWKFLSLNLLD